MIWALLACTDPGPDRQDSSESVELPFDSVRIEPGTFWMGAPETEAGRHADEVLHQVTLTRPFAIGVVPVLEREWLDWMGPLPQDDAYGDTWPVRWLSWHDAALLANAVSEDLGLAGCYDCVDAVCTAQPAYACEGVRMPTEAEWEYAARAGSGAAFHTGADLVPGTEEDCSTDTLLDDGTRLSDQAWYCANSDYWPTGTRSFEPNAWGLHDVHGTSYEWVHDGYASYPDEAVTDPEGPSDSAWVSHRGGSWGSKPYNLRLARRSEADPAVAGHGGGVRLVRTLEL